MPDPITAASLLGGFVAWLIPTVAGEVLGGRFDQHLVGGLLNKYSPHTNHDIQKAMQAAWTGTVNSIFAAYFKEHRDSFRQLPYETQRWLKDNQQSYISQEFLEALLHESGQGVPVRRTTPD